MLAEAGRVFEAKFPLELCFQDIGAVGKKSEERVSCPWPAEASRSGLNSDLATRRRNSEAQKVLVAGDEMCDGLRCVFLQEGFKSRDSEKSFTFRKS
ncbi:hypothetical protein AVEN_225045-1 [Araneus ventricosus]|uniref:Uncharacterized protein n=1 Tax=Araneus ventricosus TaxID=182803 RepID=A0A4Y2IU69_ARAVE|nr:hypothetical protein AVEN_225045-1 [Araneus ventricosus]